MKLTQHHEKSLEHMRTTTTHMNVRACLDSCKTKRTLRTEQALYTMMNTSWALHGALCVVQSAPNGMAQSTVLMMSRTQAC